MIIIQAATEEYMPCVSINRRFCQSFEYKHRLLRIEESSYIAGRGYNQKFTDKSKFVADEFSKLEEGEELLYLDADMIMLEPIHEALTDCDICLTVKPLQTYKKMLKKHGEARTTWLGWFNAGFVYLKRSKGVDNLLSAWVDKIDYTRSFGKCDQYNLVRTIGEWWNLQRETLDLTGTDHKRFWNSSGLWLKLLPEQVYNFGVLEVEKLYPHGVKVLHFKNQRFKKALKSNFWLRHLSARLMETEEVL